MPGKPEVVGDPFAELSIGGEVFRFSEIRMRTVGQVQQYLNGLPPPDRGLQDISGLPDRLSLSAEVLATVPEADRSATVVRMAESLAKMVERQVREARAESAAWPPPVGSPDFANLVAIDEGVQAELFYHLLRQHHPEVDRARSDGLLRTMTMRQWVKVITAAFPAGDEAPDPNPTAAPGT